MSDIDALLAAQAAGPKSVIAGGDPIDALLAAQAKSTPAEPVAIGAGKAINANLDSIPRQLGLTARYGLEGLANTAQIFTEPVSSLMRAGGIKTKSLGEMATGLSDAMGLPSPQTANERVIGDASRLVAGSGGMMGAASAASKLPGMLGSVMSGLSANPASQIGAATGSGLLGGASREAGGSPMTQTGASVVGGVLGGLAPGGASSLLDTGKRLVTPTMTPQQLDVQLTAVLGKAGQDYAQLPFNVKSGLRAELATSLQAGKELDPSAVARLADFKTVGATPTRGMVSQDPVQITREMNLAKISANSGDSSLHGLPLLQNQNNSTLIRNLNDSGATRGDAFQAGSNAINAISARDASMKSGVTSLYDAARAMPGGDIPIDRTKVVNAVYDALAKQNKMAYLPEDISNTLNSISAGQVTRNGQTFKVPFDANALDNLMTDIATAQRGTRDGNISGALKIARQAIDGAELSPVKPSFDGRQVVTKELGDALAGADAQAPAFMDALNKARSAHAQRMGWQESAKPVEAALGGAQPDNFIKRFVVGGTVADAESLAKNAPATGIKDAILAHLKEKALNGSADEVGKFSQSAYNKALMQIGERKLELFFNPEEMTNLKAVGRVASYMQNQPVGAAVNNSNSGALVLGRGADVVGALAGKFPLGKQLISDPLRNINISLSQRGAQNVLPGLLMQQPKQPLGQSLLLPGLATAGGLLAP